MKLLHILKTDPDETTRTLMSILSEGQSSSVFPLYDRESDYSELLDLIFESDKVISWW